jgi:hypothetical protein
MTEESLFHEVLAKPAGERAALLDAACAKEPQLRAAVEALLAAHEASGELLGRPLAAPSEPPCSEPSRPEQTGPAVTSVYQPTSVPGAVVGGRYTLVERIGEGGMGEVWVAKQTEPVKRKVALKLIKAGMDSKAVLQRFDQERQALALMDHPNIAKVLDGGVTGDHRPYFVMELVNGLPLTKFCDQMKLPVRERLELFTPICQAVQHAHQKGIVHRDLKPSNILVTIIDGKPVPKVIDFGVAKATSGKLTDETMSTGFGAVVGTLEYMAPEQAGFAGADIDTRADIYSLGVILYELLTGLRPIDGERLRTAALSEMVRIIEDEVPSKPSTRLSTHESLPSLAALRQTEPKKLMAMLRGELDWVVMKCLEKQRDRRYETANGLARDLQRYLADEPVEARPPSAGYRFRKFVRRHKGSAIAASLVVVALVTGMAGTTWQWIRAERARADEAGQRSAAEANEQKANAAANGERLAKLDAQAKEQLAVAAAEKEKAARLEEERQRQFAEAISRFVQDDFLALTSVEGQDRFGGEGKEALSKDTTLRELLDRAANKLRQRNDLDPLIEAELFWMVGVNYRGAGDAQKGIGFLERALKLRTDLLGRDHVQTLYAMNSLATAYFRDAKFELALPLYEETVKLMRASLGAEHRVTLKTLCNLAAAYQSAGHVEAALLLYQETLALQKAQLGVEDPETLSTMAKLASAYEVDRKLDLALPLYEETLKFEKAELGPEHPDTLTTMNLLARAYQLAGKMDLAFPLSVETHKLCQARLGPEHPETISSMGNLAMAYLRTGKQELALPLLEETLKLRKAKLGGDHPESLVSMMNLAEGYAEVGKHELALPLLEETVKLQKAKLPADHPSRVTGMNNLAAMYWSLGKFDKSVPLFEELLSLTEKKLGRGHPSTFQAMVNLGVNYKDAGRPQEAIGLLEEGYRGSKKNPQLRWIGQALLDAYAKAGDTAKVADLLHEQLGEARNSLPKDSPELAGLLAQICLGLLELQQWAEAESLLRECLAVREKAQPDEWSTFNTKSMLGGALLGQKKYAEAEPLLVNGYEGMHEREKTIPPQGKVRLVEALQHLVQFYEATEKKDESAKWRMELYQLNAQAKGR